MMGDTMKVMQAAWLNPFIAVWRESAGQLFSAEVELGSPMMNSALLTSQPLNLVISVSGTVTGQVLYGISSVTAVKITNARLRSNQLIFDDQATHELMRWGESLVEQAQRLYSAEGISSKIATPTLVKGIGQKLADIPSLTVVTDTLCGKITISWALTDSADKE
jgi:chemotaxis protein CheX